MAVGHDDGAAIGNDDGVGQGTSADVCEQDKKEEEVHALFWG